MEPLTTEQAIKQIEDMGWTLLHDVLPNDEQTHIVYIFESGKEFPFRHFTTGPDKRRAVLNMLESLRCDDCGRNIPVSEFDENTPGLCLSCYRQKVREAEGDFKEAAHE